jgi:hypothetical protein
MCQEFGGSEGLGIGDRGSTPGIKGSLDRKHLSTAEADFAGSRHRVEDARNDLRGAGPAGVVGKLRFEQLGVGKNDPELVVQAVKQKAEI